MRKLLVAAVVMMACAAERANAQRPSSDGLYMRTVTIDRQSGDTIPAVTRLHPVIGSTQFTSRFNLPFAHKARYSTKMYNPLLGSFVNRNVRR